MITRFCFICIFYWYYLTKSINQSINTCIDDKIHKTSWWYKCSNTWRTSKFRELWSPARQHFWPLRRSKVKVTAWGHLKGLVTRIMHAKYQCSIFNTSEDMSQVKVFVTDEGTDRGTDRQTDEWDLMSPRFRESGGQKAVCIALQQSLDGRRTDWQMDKMITIGIPLLQWQGPNNS